MAKANTMEIATRALSAPPEDGLALGRLIGHHEAFGFVATRMSGMWAQTLIRIREGEEYKALGLTWEEFCSQKLGLDKSTANRIITEYKELGPMFFTLKEALGRISRESFTLIEGAVNEDGTVQVGDRTLKITRDNAQEIRDYIEDLRTAHRKAKEETANAVAREKTAKEARKNAEDAATKARESLDAIKRADANAFADAGPFRQKVLKSLSSILGNLERLRVLWETSEGMERAEVEAVGNHITRMVIEATSDQSPDHYFMANIQPFNPLEGYVAEKLVAIEARKKEQTQ